jgi:hypothetical protein
VQLRALGETVGALVILDAFPQDQSRDGQVEPPGSHDGTSRKPAPAVPDRKPPAPDNGPDNGPGGANGGGPRRVGVRLMPDGTPTEPEEITADSDARRFAAIFREEVGEILGGISDDELLLIAKIFRNNGALRKKHRFGVYDGDMLMFVAEIRSTENRPGGRLWEPYVSGRISEVFLPCEHTQMTQPEMLQKVWSEISKWLDAKRD